MAQRVERKVDVPAENGGVSIAQIAATVFLPDAPVLSDSTPTVVAFMFPGGGYSRNYYSLDLPGAAVGGQAAWHTDRGWIVVAIDHLQVGDSTVVEPDTVTFEDVSSANNAAVEHILTALADGTLADDYPPVVDPVTIGIGQSMGGCFTIVLQGQHDVFDGVAILGYSAIHTVVPSRPGTPEMAMPWILRSSYPHAPAVLNQQALAAAAAPDPEAGHVWTWAFHHDTEPRDIVDRDMAAMTGGPVPPWRSATIPACAILMVAPGAVAAEAAAITTPVFIGVGERDVVPDPMAEPKAYKSSRDITVAVFANMAHMHNFAPTREQLWSRLHTWADSLSAHRR